LHDRFFELREQKPDGIGLLVHREFFNLGSKILYPTRADLTGTGFQGMHRFLDGLEVACLCGDTSRRESLGDILEKQINHVADKFVTA
jgi:hypothetical protein